MAENSDHTATDHPILFFDGGCALCHGAVRRLLRWEKAPHNTLHFAPLDGPTAVALRAQRRLPEDQEAGGVHTTQGTWTGEAAVAHALNLIGRSGWSRTFRILPPPLRQAGYRLIARNRSRWFGRVPAECPFPAAPGRMQP